MKKGLRFLLFTFVMLVCFSAHVMAATVPTVEVMATGTTGMLTWTVNKVTRGTLVVYNLALSGSGTMPNYNEGDAPWCKAQTTGGIVDYSGMIQGVTIGDGVTSVGNYAFAGFAKLAQLNIPAGVKTIGLNSFRGCVALSKFTVSESNTKFYVNDDVLYEGPKISTTNSQIKLVRYPAAKSDASTYVDEKGLTGVYDGAFEGNGALKEIYLSERVTNVGPGAFNNCENLELIHLGGNISGLVSVKNVAAKGKFIEKTGATSSVSIPSGWEHYHHYGMPMLETSKGYAATCGTKLFYYSPDAAAKVSYIQLGSGGGVYPWMDNGTKYTEMEIHKNVGSIDDGAIYNKTLCMSALETISVDEENEAFCVVDNVLYNKEQTVLYKYPAASNRSNFKLPILVESIYPYAFSYASKLQEVEIDSELSSIGEYAFAYTPSLKFYNYHLCTCPSFDNKAFVGCASSGDVKCMGTEEFKQMVKLMGSGWNIISNAEGSWGDLTWRYENGLLIISGNGSQMATREHPWDMYKDWISKILIKEGVESVPSYTFANYPELVEVTLEGGGYVRYESFIGCTKLKRVNIGSGVTCFTGIPSSNSKPFTNCSQFTEVNVKDWNSYCNIKGLEYLLDADGTPKEKVLYINGVKYEDDVLVLDGCPQSHAFCSFVNVKKIKLQNVTKVENDTFSGYRFLESIDLPNSITEIGNAAFYECVNLKSIDIPPFVNSIGVNAFNGCSKFEKIELPETVSYIGMCAFKNCVNLSSIVLPNRVEDIVDRVFEGCSNLASFSCLGDVKSIGKFAFADCPKLTEMRVPNKVLDIAEGTFKGCSSLTKLEYGDLNTIGNEAFAGCSITRFDVPASLTSLGLNVFANCSNLAQINVTDIIAYCKIKGLNAIYSEGSPRGKTFLINGTAHPASETLVLPGEVTTLSPCLFSGYDNVLKVELPETMKMVPSESFKDNPFVQEVTINGSSVKSLAFQNCTSLKRVNLGPNVSMLIMDAVGYYSRKVYPFENCENLSEINVTDVDKLYDISGMMYLIDSEYKTAPVKTLYINGVMHNPDNTLYVSKAPKIKTYNVFSTFCNVKKIELLDGYTSLQGEFSHDEHLTSITLPSTMEEVYPTSFAECPNLSKITCWANVPPFVNKDFVDVPSSITLYVPAESVQAYKEATGWSAFNVVAIGSETEDIEPGIVNLVRLIELLKSDSSTTIDDVNDAVNRILGK